MRRLALLLAVSCATVAPLTAQSLPRALETGEMLFARGDYAAAEEAFTRELNGPAARPTTLYNRALARHNQQKNATAKRDLDAFLLAKPHSPPALSLRAALHLQLGDPRAAVSDADDALALDASDMDARLTRARANVALGRDDQAAADFTRLLPDEAEAANAGALLARGDWHAARNRLPEALADFTRATQLVPADPDAHFKLGSAHFRSLEFAPALASLQRAMELTPRVGALPRTAGLVYYAQGNFAAGAVEFRRAIELDPAGSSYAVLMLWLSERRLGQTDDLPPPATTVSPWLALLQAFLRGEAGEDDLFLGAQNLTPAEDRAGRLCEAHFFSGSLLLLRGELRAAHYAFQQALAAYLPAYAEYTLARAELQRMPLPPEKPARPRRH